MIAIISDIHGNYEALKEVLKAIDEMGISHIYCLGDVVGYYSQVNECCDELRRRDMPCLIGNHDWYMLADSFCDRSKSVNDCLEYQRKIITDENKQWLYSFKAYNRLDELFMVHGGWTDPIDEYLTQPTDEYFAKVKGKNFSSGHTHIQRIEDFGNKLYCNPGSVGQPRDGDRRAAFATWDGNKFELHRVDYDFKKVGELMEAAGFSGYYYSCLASGANGLGWYDEDGKKTNNV